MTFNRKSDDEEFQSVAIIYAKMACAQQDTKEED